MISQEQGSLATAATCAGCRGNAAHGLSKRTALRDGRIPAHQRVTSQRGTLLRRLRWSAQCSLVICRTGRTCTEAANSNDESGNGEM
eukprot:576270-Amphidinium_carterae.1